ncbi:MAG: PAS domain S-box protein [Thermodesulfobacteriota bacterium]
MKHLPIRIKLILGFGAVGIITLFVGLTGWLGLWHLKGILKEINGVRLPGIVGVAELQGHMWAIQRFERVLLYEKDPEIIKRQYTQLEKAWNEAGQLLNKYERLPKTKEESQLWDRIAAKWEAWKVLHQTVIGLIKKGDQNSLRYAHELSYGKARTVFLEAQEIITHLLNVSLSITAEDHDRAETSEYRAMIILAGCTLAGVLAVLFLGLFVTKSIQKSHEILRKSENWFSTTLKSIGDAVIATGPQGQITFMNAVAQALTGWPMEEALGRPVEEVFHIVNEETGAPVENPVTRVIREGVVVGLANHTVLIAKDGTRIPIDDSGAPIKDDQGNIIGAVLVFQDITESKEAEEALRASEEEYRLLFENVQVGVFRTRIGDGKILKANHRLAEIFGYEKYGEFLQEFVASEHYADPGARERLITSFREGKLESYEIRASRKDGAIVWLLISGRINPEEGYVEGVATDITEQKQVELALQESQEQYRLLVNQIPAVVFKGYADWSVDFFDQKIEVLTGYPKADFDSRRLQWSHLILPEDLKRIKRALIDFLKTAGPYVREYRIRKKSGEIAWIQERSQIFCDAAGRIKHASGVFFDITERKQVEEAVKGSEEKMRLVIESSPIGIGIGQSGQLAYANPSLAKMHGYNSPAEMVGQSIKNFYAPEYHGLIGQTTEMLESGQPIIPSYEAKVIKKNGEVFDISVWLRKIDYQGQPAILWFAIDVTEQKALRAQLFQAQKLEAIGTLAGGIAHDFNNILSALMGYTELTLDDIPPEMEAHANLVEVLKAAERARDLVKQILTFSRQDKHQEKKPVQISLIIKEVLKFLRASLPTTIDMRRNITALSAKILADPTQIHQIMINLCTNAAQAMQESGGVLTVSLDEVDLRPGDQAPGADLLSGPYLRLTVSDTGQGMTPEVMARIFEPFFTTKELGGGTGMGLAVVHGIVKSHGGEIKVFSEPGQGSTFQVFFPRVDNQEITETPILPAVLRGQERILLVDDEESLAHLGRQMLKRLGYEAVAMTNSLEALEAFRAQPHRFDLVITDQTMPHMTGIKLAEELLRIRPGLPIILCTGFIETVSPEEALARGLRELIAKPLKKGELAKIIRKVLDENT